jgi:hypothetical protein
MPISSSSKACRGDTGCFGAADVVEVAIMGGPARFISISMHCYTTFPQSNTMKLRICNISRILLIPRNCGRRKRRLDAAQKDKVEVSLI